MGPKHGLPREPVENHGEPSHLRFDRFITEGALSGWPVLGDGLVDGQVGLRDGLGVKPAIFSIYLPCIMPWRTWTTQIGETF